MKTKIKKMIKGFLNASFEAMYKNYAEPKYQELKETLIEIRLEQHRMAGKLIPVEERGGTGE